MSSFHDSSVMHVTSITLLIQNLKRSLAFYQDILGFFVHEISAVKVGLSANEKDILIYLQEDRNALPLGLTLGLYHYALLLSSQASLAQIIVRLKDKHYPITGASDHGVSEALYLDDPDGHGIEIYCDRPKNMWPIEQGSLSMYTKALNVASILSFEIQKTYMIDPNMCMGHLHFHVSNLSEALTFYKDALGFEITLRMNQSAVFMSSSGYHHHIGLNTWQGNASLTKEKQVGLKSYVLFISRADYPALLRRLYDHHIPLIKTDDGNYVIDPLGQKIVFDVQ